MECVEQIDDDMPITITPAKLYTPKLSHKFMKSMASGGLARFIALEAFVETGRTYQAYQRGGFDEGRERITEEFTGAVFWLGGVKAFNAINDKIGKAILKMKNAKFDLGRDSARDTVRNFIYEEGKLGNTFTDKTVARFKAAKLVASILMANAMIGFVVPKINQSITRYYHRNDKPIAEQTQNLQEQNQNNSDNIEPPRPGMDKFLNKSDKKQNKDISFGSKFSMFDFAYLLENNTTCQLLSTDVGTATGRTISARNNDERREILFRDLSSIIFYMFNMPFVNWLMNKIEQGGKGRRIDSVNADYTTELMKQIVRENGGKITAKVLGDEMLGENKDFKLPKEFKDKYKCGFIELDENFKNVLSQIPEVNTPEKLEQYSKLAEEMSKLQPQIEGKSRITLEQLERMFKGGYLNNPEFLKNLYELSFGKNKKTGLAEFLNPYKFISTDTIAEIDDDVKFYVESIIKKAKKSGDIISTINEDMLTKACKANFRYNVLNWGTGFAISALFLSTLIPKMQYWITKKVTGNDAFPGTEEYRKQQETQAKPQEQAKETK